MVTKIIQRVIVAMAIIFAMSFMTSSVVFADAKEDIAKYTARIKANPNDSYAYFFAEWLMMN